MKQTTGSEYAPRDHWDETLGIHGPPSLANLVVFGDGQPVSQDDGDDGSLDDLPSIEDILFEARHKGPSNFKRKASQQSRGGDREGRTGSNPSIRKDGDLRPPRKRRRRQTTSPATNSASPVQREVIDLTVNIEHCAICSNVLGQGDENAARMFVFAICRCVVCGECLLSNLPEECESPITITELWCPRNSHFSLGEQDARELFNASCSVCFETAADKYDRLSLETLAARATRVGGQRLVINQSHLRSPAAEVELIQTPCGHAFCRSCISQWIESDPGRRCPSCRSSLPRRIAKLPSFETLQRGVVYQTSLDDTTHR